MDKNTKILIPEIPGEWTQLLRSGKTNIWNEARHGKPHTNGLPEVRLDSRNRALCRAYRLSLVLGVWLRQVQRNR
ncbi:hypothetical protein [Pseudomonas sp. SWRI81]|uniref:hypothetical protein n=1 Tax=Pseudomonas sp. SWRI81 TaxID=2745505 RepID=UPI001EE27DE2|nr:hypothetical protein [Pseudomonas sp. SWRI81]